MIIPSVPNEKFLDTSKNIPSVPWRVFFSSLIGQMQHFVSDDSTILPTKTKEDINQIDAAPTQANFVGGILHDNTALNMKVKTETGKPYKNVSTLENLPLADINAIPSGQRDGRFIFETGSPNLHVGFNDTFKKVTVT